jgi:subtilisin-like proprotein convertase family protein
VVALILSANPSLSYRDVRDILVKTSTKVMDKAYVTGTDNVTRYTSINRTVNLTTPAGTFLAHPGWVKNAAGFEFNNYYGFGRPNAGKAVEMAKAATPLGPQKMSAWTGVGTYGSAGAALAQNVPDNSSVGTTIQVNVTDDVTLEGAQFKFAISNPEFALGFTDTAGAKVQTTAGVDLAIEVTSPAGTRSVLLASKQALILPALDPDTFDFVPGSILLDSVFLSNAFYGEKSKGTWTIKVLDVNGNGYNANGGFLQVAKYVNNSVPSVVDGVAVRVFGR